MTSKVRTVERDASSISSIDSTASGTNNNNNDNNKPNVSKVRFPSVGEVALGLVTHHDYEENYNTDNSNPPTSLTTPTTTPGGGSAGTGRPVLTTTDDDGDDVDVDDDGGDDDSSNSSNNNDDDDVVDGKNRTPPRRNNRRRRHRRQRHGGAATSSPVARKNRTFYGQTAELVGAGEPSSSTALPGPPLGAAGTFRSKALTRRYVNSSRRHLLKQNQGMSTKSLLSTTSNEATPLLVSPTGGGRDTSSSKKALMEVVNLSIRIDKNQGKGGQGTAIIDNLDSTPSGLGGGGDGVSVDEAGKTLWGNFRDIWFGKPISLCLLVVPFAVLSHYLHWNATWVFWLNFFAMLPLAAILGDFTEEAALHTNDTIGGLLNATFGNAVEVVVAIQALLVNEIRVVQASMIGSIFSNLLLVLGTCFFMGGLYYKEQTFNSTSATASMGLLALGSIAMVLPTPFAMYYDVQDDRVLIISRLAACFLLFMYLQLLFFQLYTHKHIFDEVDESSRRQNDDVDDSNHHNDDDGDNNSSNNKDDDDNKDDEEPRIPMWMALLGLFLTTAAVTVFSDFLVGSIDEFCKDSGISRTFVGLIILPIVGNAVEHVSAVTVAMKNKMDLAMGVALGSCTQISLFVVPLTVLVGWGTDKPMSLNFPHFEITLYVLSIFTVSICLANPRCNWLEGSLLCTTYLMIAIGFWFEEVVDF